MGTVKRSSATKPPTRSRASAKAAGARFERQIADCLSALVDDRIDRRVKTGAKDRGDIGGVRLHGERVVIECKNTTRLNLSGWATEVDNERGNDDALVGMVIHKRHGTADPLDQWVTMPVRELVAILTGRRIEEA
ncbi:hypothetical protein [Tomitella gaofuii]|uniref:hypothetical protein n=1 Tax=Tomitella gaofuii TaxID=2760083 RepID=UPI0015FB8480|nr:hypothetical protein [Tomitella gaofuii]